MNPNPFIVICIISPDSCQYTALMCNCGNPESQLGKCSTTWWSRDQTWNNLQLFFCFWRTDVFHNVMPCRGWRTLLDILVCRNGLTYAKAGTKNLVRYHLAWCLINVKPTVCHSRQVRELEKRSERLWVGEVTPPVWSQTAHSHTLSPRLCDTSHTHTHSRTLLPTSPPVCLLSLWTPLIRQRVLWVAASGRGQSAGRVYQGTVSTPALCSALFSFPLLLPHVPHICHPCRPSRSLLRPVPLIPVRSFSVLPLVHSFCFF